jgi:hypothetical protein
MPNIPMVFEPKGTFASLLACIKEYNPVARKSDIALNIKSFLADPIIKDMLDDSQALATTAVPIPLELGDKIQATLKLLSQVISSIQKRLSTLPKQQPTPATVKRGKGPITAPPRKYSAIAGSRPPNPSLVVDLAQLKLTDEDWPKLEAIC